MVRQSAAVYRRRRLVVLTVLLLILGAVAVGVWALIAQPWSAQAGEAKPVPVASADATPTAAADEETPVATPVPVETTAPPPGIAPCVAANIEVAPLTDQETYAAGQLPQLSISLTNKGTADCTLDVGTATQQFTITSGTDVWWRSTDCQTDPTNQLVTLAAGATVSSATPVQWDRTRSGVDQCDSTSRQVAPAGGASYHFSAGIGGFESKTSRQVILR